GELVAARVAYREADRRAPREDKAEIASRLGWLSKEMGEGGAANRYFARSRGTGYPIGLAQILVAVTVIGSRGGILGPGAPIVPQLVPIIILNLAIGFASGGTIDNSAHIGGLLAGMWLGLVVPPGKVPTLRSAWQHPSGQPATTSPLLIAAGIVLLIAVIAAG